MITPSTNVEITQNMGPEGISRIEEYFPVKTRNADYDLDAPTHVQRDSTKNGIHDVPSAGTNHLH